MKSLGDRMKEYENVTRQKLTRRGYTIIRIDGKAFHSYTVGLEKPFDEGFMDDMNATAAYLCQNIQGAQFAYVQSDEISILVTDFNQLETESWFDNNLQKMCSVSASMATAAFNKARIFREWYDTKLDNFKFGEFDARVFQLPYPDEVVNYFLWRQQDAERNAIQSIAQYIFGHKGIFGKNTAEMTKMIENAGEEHFLEDSQKMRGRFIFNTRVIESAELTGSSIMQDGSLSNKFRVTGERTQWTPAAKTPKITKDRDFIRSRIKNNYE